MYAVRFLSYSRLIFSSLSPLVKEKKKCRTCSNLLFSISHSVTFIFYPFLLLRILYKIGVYKRKIYLLLLFGFIFPRLTLPSFVSFSPNRGEGEEQFPDKFMKRLFFPFHYNSPSLFLFTSFFFWPTHKCKLVSLIERKEGRGNFWW